MRTLAGWVFVPAVSIVKCRAFAFGSRRFWGSWQMTFLASSEPTIFFDGERNFDEADSPD
jgi:hypothetical protein